jgi:hypothetical protein
VENLSEVIRSLADDFCKMIVKIDELESEIAKNASNIVPSYAAVTQQGSPSPTTYQAPAPIRMTKPVIPSLVLSGEEALGLASRLRTVPRGAFKRYVRTFVTDIRPCPLGQLRRQLNRLGICPRPMELCFLGRAPILEITTYEEDQPELVSKLTELKFSVRTGISPEDPSLLTGARWEEASPEERESAARSQYIGRLKRTAHRQVRPSMTGFLTKEIYRLGEKPEIRQTTVTITETTHPSEAGNSWKVVTRNKRGKKTKRTIEHREPAPHKPEPEDAGTKTGTFEQQGDEPMGIDGEAGMNRPSNQETDIEKETELIKELFSADLYADSNWSDLGDDTAMRNRSKRATLSPKKVVESETVKRQCILAHERQKSSIPPTEKTDSALIQVSASSKAPSLL